MQAQRAVVEKLTEESYQQPFRPNAYYDFALDRLYITISNARAINKHVTPYFTLHLDGESEEDQLVGFVLCGVVSELKDRGVKIPVRMYVREFLRLAHEHIEGVFGEADVRVFCLSEDYPNMKCEF